MIDQIKASNQGIIEFLLIDLDVALTFMDVADTTEFRDTAERNHRNARQAYDTVVRTLQEVTLNEDQRAMFQPRLQALRSRLEAAGRL